MAKITNVESGANENHLTQHESRRPRDPVATLLTLRSRVLKGLGVGRREEGGEKGEGRLVKGGEKGGVRNEGRWDNRGEDTEKE